eukprot:1135756-Alexandrium_andersonii.AAC.1
MSMPSILANLIVRLVLRLAICPPVALKCTSLPLRVSVLAASNGRFAFATWNARRRLRRSFAMRPRLTSP